MTIVVVAAVPSVALSSSEESVIMPFTPLPRTGKIQRFSFLVYGDIQGNYKNGHDALVEQMLKEPVDLVFNTGDISPHKGRHYVRDFYPVIQKLARRISFFPAIGNHDVAWKSPVSRYPFFTFFHRIYDYLSHRPNNEHLLDPVTQKLWYSISYGDTLFIVLDSNLFIDEGHYRKTHTLGVYENYREDQMIWVRDLLEKTSLSSDIRAKFVFFHHSPFASRETNAVPVFGWGGHRGHRRMVVNQTLPSEQSDEEQYLLDLFRLHGVTAVFTGHEHYYERWREIIWEEGHPVHSLHWIVNGLGGVKPRGRPEYEEDEIEELLEEEGIYRDYLTRISGLNPGWKAELQHAYPTESNSAARFHNYILVTVDGSAIRFETKDILGSVRDEGFFSLTDLMFRSAGDF